MLYFLHGVNAIAAQMLNVLFFEEGLLFGVEIPVRFAYKMHQHSHAS